MKKLRMLLTLFLILMISTSFTYADGFLQHVEATGYDKDVDYMQKIAECIEHNTEHSIQVGRIYEQQRNLKIENESLEAEKSNIFNSYNIDEIRDNYNQYNGIVEQVEEVVGVSMELPNVNTSFKSYMSYKAITSKGSLQWKYRQLAYTDESGFRRINDDYVVALGTYYSQQCGERFRITLSSGKVFTAITGDIKSDRHTDSTNRYIPKNGNVVEFLVDVGSISKKSRQMGDMSYSGFEGSIISIEKL